MKKTTLFLFILSTLFLSFNVNAQMSSQVDESFDQSGFVNNLWYGGGLVLGFSGTTGGSLFQFGVTPMVGYKITEHISVGPRVGITYQHIKGDAIDETRNVEVRQVGLTEYTAGIFARLKFLRQFFIHAEGEYRSSEFALGNSGLLSYNLANGEVNTIRESEFNPIAGAGYSSSMSALWGYEIMILYRFNIPENDRRSPFDIRFGVNYNF